MKRYQIQTKPLNGAADWETIADTDSPLKAIKLARNLRPPMHSARVWDFQKFDSIHDIDAMGHERQREKAA